jgi:hypothetical protein
MTFASVGLMGVAGNMGEHVGVNQFWRRRRFIHRRLLVVKRLVVCTIPLSI